jgi:hypothetical protein
MGSTVYCCLAFFFFSCASSALFYTLEESFAYTIAAFAPFFLDSLTFFVICGLHRFQGMVFLECILREQSRALEGDGVQAEVIECMSLWTGGKLDGRTMEGRNAFSKVSSSDITNMNVEWKKKVKTRDILVSSIGHLFPHLS